LEKKYRKARRDRNKIEVIIEKFGIQSLLTEKKLQKLYDHVKRNR
jgi:hypothetical protein